MSRKLIVILASLIFSMALTFDSIADDGVDFRLFNPKTITNDLDATYITGDISRASGQRIEIRNTDGFVTEKIIPANGGRYEFRIKLPKSSIDPDKTTTFAVMAHSRDGNRIRTTYARVAYKPKKEQHISVDEEELKLDIPGKNGIIKAASSAGLALKYSSSDEKVVQVDSLGNLVPIGGGTADVTISHINNNEYEDATKTIKVSVKERPYYTIRFHLGPFTAKELGRDAEQGEQEQFTIIAGVNNIDVENTEDLIVEQKIAIDEPTQLLQAMDKKGDFEFLGWSSSATGYLKYGNSEEVTNIAEANQTVDLYAIWHGERAMKAIAWAEKIAADDSFTYGQGTPRCYFCGTAPKKQYTCMPFLAAAYAHGAGDPVNLSGGRHVMHLHEGNFKGELGTIWEKLGACRDLTIDDLRPGDVIIKYSAGDNSGHAWMYGGDDRIIEAASSGIHVLNHGAASALRRYGSASSKNFVMRYRF